jgi:hypothetical protein
MNTKISDEPRDHGWFYNHVGRLSGLALGLIFVIFLLVLAANGYAPATSLLGIIVGGFLMISIGSMMRGGAR